MVPVLATLAKVGANTTPSAMTTLKSDGPKTATATSARRIPGKHMMLFENSIMIRSQNPPK